MRERQIAFVQRAFKNRAVHAALRGGGQIRFVDFQNLVEPFYIEQNSAEHGNRAALCATSAAPRHDRNLTYSQFSIPPKFLARSRDAQ